MYIINFKTIRYKLTASGNIIHSILNYKPIRPLRYLRLPREQKQQSQEKMERVKCRRHQKMKSNGFSLNYQYSFKKSTNMTKYTTSAKF